MKGQLARQAPKSSSNEQIKPKANWMKASKGNGDNAQGPKEARIVAKKHDPIKCHHHHHHHHQPDIRFKFSLHKSKLMKKASHKREAHCNKRTRMWPKMSAAGHRRLRKHLPACLLLLVGALCLLAVFACFRSANAASSSSLQQYFEVQPEAQYLVPSGQEVRLRCLIRNRQGECVWLHNGRVMGQKQRKYAYLKTPDDGDCSLLVRNTSVAADDGLWQCQVISSEVDTDNLLSREVHLLVLVAPERPQIKNLSQGNKLILEEKKEKFVTCEMRGGNPAPRMEWYLDGKNVTKEAQQTSSTGSAPNQAQTSGGSAQTRITHSKLRLNDIRRSMNGKNLTCVGVHQLLNQSTSVELDVQYLPAVSVIQREYSIVEGSPLTISCQVDSNPPPSLVNWRLVSDGSSQRQKSTTSNDKEALVANKVGPVLEFERIGREYNQNIFECLAQNSYGVSMPTDVKLNVLYAPYLVNTSHSDSIHIGQDAKLMCQFEGNPQPEIKWLYTDPMSKSASAQVVDTSALSDKQYLLIKNTTYRNEGDYHCEARNTINGQTFAVRSSNIILDIFGEPQFLAKSPVHAKIVQGSKSDISLTFCSDPPPYKVYWQYGSIRIEVSRVLNLSTGLVQPLQGTNGVAAAAPPGGSKQHAGLASRFQAQPLQPLQKRESFYSKTPTCFESTLTLLEPELNDQRDYQLMVVNEQGHAFGSVRLRVTSPLSPVLMISSAFVTIFGLFICSLLFMFVFKRRQQFMASGRSLRNGQANGQQTNGVSGAASQTNGSIKSALDETDKSRTNNGYSSNGHLASQTKGVVNGTGNGLANGASNPASGAAHGDQLLPSVARQLDDQLLGKHVAAGNLLSMASSDTSCNDQRQLISSNGSDRMTNSTSSSSNAQANSDHHHHRNQLSPSERSTANSTPTIPMNHISVDDELQLNGTYQATESVTRDAQLSPLHAGSMRHHQLQAGANNALIYANIDYNEQFGLAQPLSRPATLRRQQQTSHTPELDSPSGSQRTVQEQPVVGSGCDQDSPPVSVQQRPSVGATIAMMNSLAAAAAGQPQLQQVPGQGVLNGAINQQLSARGQLRKPGPPKPPKPSIQQRSQFYQQRMRQQQPQGGLVMIGGDPAQMIGDAEQAPTGQEHNELALEYSRLAFPARAEL